MKRNIFIMLSASLLLTSFFHLVFAVHDSIPGSENADIPFNSQFEFSANLVHE